MAEHPELAAVVIGRNEGERLRRCLASLAGQVGCIVYVDSGSTDGSTDVAARFGAEVVALDLTSPFTAARARNAGFERALERAPGLRWVQFVDGDCEVVAGWLEQGLQYLEDHPDAAVVCGRRRERFPQASVYNLLCDIEWNVAAGPARACGGDAMIRAQALAAAGGYRPDLIAGEEPELCVRLRAQGWKVHVLDAAMTLHDAAMTRFGQWWLRTVRAGYAYAEGVFLHGRAPERHAVRELTRAVAWSLLPPLLAAALLLMAGPGWAFAVLAIYPLQALRLWRVAPGGRQQRAWRALFLVVGKFAELQGALRYWRLRWTRQRAQLIEYK